PALRHEWETPALWSRIEAAFVREDRARQRPPLRTWLAAAAVLLAALAGAWLLVQAPAPPRDALELPLQQRLLSERALREVASAELSVHASIRVSADDDAAAAAFGNAIRIDVEDGPAAVGVKTVYPESHLRGREISFSVDYEIVMPETIPLDVRNAFGDVAAT